MEIVREVVDELARDAGIVDVVDGTDDVVRVSCRAHLAVRVARLEEPAQLGVAGVVDSFVCLVRKATAVLDLGRMLLR